MKIDKLQLLLLIALEGHWSRFGETETTRFFIRMVFFYFIMDILNSLTNFIMNILIWYIPKKACICEIKHELPTLSVSQNFKWEVSLNEMKRNRKKLEIILYNYIIITNYAFRLSFVWISFELRFNLFHETIWNEIFETIFGDAPLYK